MAKATNVARRARQMAEELSESEATKSGSEAVTQGGGSGGGGKGTLGVGDSDGGDGPALVSMAQAFSGLPMQDLIGGPLMAASDANMQMGLAQVNFIMATCFYPDESDDKIMKPRLVTCSLTRAVMDENDPATEQPPIVTKIELPLMALLPLNTLGVTNVDINFTMNVSSSYSNEKSTSLENKIHAEASYETTINYYLAKTSIKGSASIDTTLQQNSKAQYQKQNNATYTVAVSAGQLPLPPGVSTLIQAFTDNMAPLVIPARDEP